MGSFGVPLEVQEYTEGCGVPVWVGGYFVLAGVCCGTRGSRDPRVVGTSFLRNLRRTIFGNGMV